MHLKEDCRLTLSDVVLPDTKEGLIGKPQGEVEEIWDNYNNGFITNNERYNQIIDIWTRINSTVSDALLRS